jgi:hypothetical protein
MHHKLIADKSKIIVKLSKQKEYEILFKKNLELRKYFKLHNSRGKYYLLEFKTHKIIPRLFPEDSGILLPEDAAALIQGFQKNNFVSQAFWHTLERETTAYCQTFNSALARLSIFFINYDNALCSALQELQTANDILKNTLIPTLYDVSAEVEQQGRGKVAKNIENSADSFAQTAARIQRIIAKYKKTAGSKKHNFRLLKKLLRNKVLVEKVISLIDEIMYMHPDKNMHTVIRSRSTNPNAAEDPPIF